MFGVGLGKSTQKYMYIPEPHNDFIFAVLAEELGFIGCVAVIALFAIFIWRGILFIFTIRYEEILNPSNVEKSKSNVLLSKFNSFSNF